jgi:predicted Zn-dependent peptidase
MNLAYFELLGNAELINKEIDCYRKVTPEQIKSVAKQLFKHENRSELHYLSKNKN